MNIGGFDMTCGIYLITHIASGRGYVGQSVDIESRFRDHLAGRGSVKLSRALKKYGPEAFEFRVLFVCDREELNRREAEFIQQLNTLHPYGFNLIGGGGQPGAMSSETRARFREAGRRRMEDPARREALAAARAKAWRNPERRAIQRQVMLSVLSRPEVQQQLLERIDALSKDEEVKRKRAASRDKMLKDMSPEKRRELWGKARRDDRLYRFQHNPSGEVRVCRRSDLQHEFGLDSARLSELLDGSAKSHRGWVFLGEAK